MTHNIFDKENQTQSSGLRELYEVYADTSAKPRHKKKLIESLNEIYGYDLAFLVGLIMRSEFSGNLNVISHSGEISGLSFSRGNITKIDLDDQATFMGELLIKEGLLTREGLLALLDHQTQNTPLGELLIQNDIATAEQVIQILVKQMRLRLSQYINSSKYRVNFSESEVPDPGLSISYPEYLALAHDWVAGRFNAEWLKLHYMELSEGLVEVPEDIGVYPIVKSLPMSTHLSSKFKTFSELKTFSKIFASIKNEKDQEYFLKCFHYGVMSGQLTLKNNPDAEASAASMLRNIYQVCSKKTGVELVETLGQILKFKPTEIDAIFQAINNYIHIYSGDDSEMKNNMFRIVLEMLSKKEFYSDAINKKYALSEKQKVPAEISKKITEIQTELLAKNLLVVIDLLKKVNEHSSQVPKIKLYTVWAKTLMITQNNIRINSAELEREFLQILPEDKDTAEYFYVRSILALLKKDEASAKVDYQKSIKLNPDLQKYPPFKQTGSFIKKLFKLSIVLLVVTSSLNAVAQSEAPATTVKKESTSDEAFLKNKLPFVYLNQYFTYKVLDPDTIQINDNTYNLNHMIISPVDNGYEIQLEGSLEGFNKEPSFAVQSALDNKTVLVKSVAAEGKFNISTSAEVSVDFVCLNKKNQFTNIQICKSVTTNSKKVTQTLTVNGQSIEPEGTIILNDTNNQKIVLNLTRKNNDFISIETIKRLILPVKLDKPADSENFNIQFIDAGNSRYAWEDKVSLNQNSFPLKFDELMTLKQGIYFNNAVNVETGLSQTFIDKDRLQRKYYNKFFAEPIMVYSELAGKSNTTEAILRSDMGVGISITVDRYLENGQNAFGSFSYYNSKLTPNTTSARIKDPETSLMTLSGGYRYTQSDKWAFSGIARLQEDTFLNQVNVNTIALTKSLIKMVGIVPEYTLYNQGKFVVAVSAGGYLLLPTDVKDSSTTDIGTLIELDAKASYKIDWGRVTGGLTYGNRNQKNDTYTYSGSNLTYRFGLVYLF
jgi:hypothetical protein